MTKQNITLNPAEEFVPLPEGLEQKWITEKDAVFTRVPNTFSWISDVEHIINPKGDGVFRADADPAYYFAGAAIPGQTDFEIFPYHYYEKSEEETFGKRINYKMVAKNYNSTEVLLEIDGQGTTRDWDHFKTWEGALKGEKRRVIRLQPGESVTLWEETELEGGFPWSGVIFGHASADLWVCDYVYISDEDPGFEHAQPMPDMSQPGKDWPDFTRGTAPWNAAEIDMFPMAQSSSNRIMMSKVDKAAYSFAIAESPGGPETALQIYKDFEPTFKTDQLLVLDPLSQVSHLYYGGNYTILYNMTLPLANDSAEKKTLDLYFSSNDTWDVGTILAIWINGELHWRRVPDFKKNEHWHALKIDLEPGQIEDVDFSIIPLGSCWGGIVATFAVS